MGSFSRAFCLCVVLLLTSGCTAWWQALSGSSPRQGTSSSLVAFLYPDGATPPAYDETVPKLTVPLHVGVAFVPSSVSTGDALPEATRARLLEQVRSSFIGQDYIREITTIPEAYLRGHSGFDTLDQVARLYGLDVIALISYDQVAVADDRTSSLLYWTVIGAYFIKGSQNDVSTFVDTAVFDVKTHKLLLRAPGTNQIVANSTLISSPQAMRAARTESFEAAMADMTGNLQSELVRFQARIKEDKSVLVASRERGAGAVPPGLLLTGLALLVMLRRRRRS